MSFGFVNDWLIHTVQEREAICSTVSCRLMFLHAKCKHAKGDDCKHHYECHNNQSGDVIHHQDHVTRFVSFRIRNTTNTTTGRLRPIAGEGFFFSIFLLFGLKFCWQLLIVILSILFVEEIKQ